MKVMIGSLLLISLHINIYHLTDATSPKPHIRSNDETLSANSEADASSKQQNSASTGECLNNSVDSKCDFVPSKLTGTSYDYDLEEARSFTYSLLDGPSELMNRLQEIDKLDRNSVMVAMSPNSTLSWRTTEPQHTLRQVLFVHRHGDRTPINFPPKDPLASEPFWAFHGYGQLTNRGKARLYLLGKILRQRYDKFLRGSVNKNQRISRSSGSLRCIESAQVFMSSFLELDLPSSLDAPLLTWTIKKDEPLGRLWQPVSIQSVPTQFDGMLAESAECKLLTDEYMNVIDKSSAVKNINLEYRKEATIINSVLGFEIDHFYKWFWGSSQIEVERSYFANKMNPEILRIYDRLQEAGNLALGAYQSTTKAKQLRSGLLINDIVENMNNYRKGHNLFDSDSFNLKKFVHYSGHDLTLVVLLGMMDLWKANTTRPDYASNIIIELHQDDSEWYVKIYYMAQVPSEPVELHLSSCEMNHPKQRCTLYRFAELMEAYMIPDWQTWMQACNNDLHELNPYTPGK